LRNYLLQNGHRVIIANGMVEDLPQAVYRYPEKKRADFFTALVQKENITHVLWQYSPYAMHAKGTPWWVLGAMRALRKTGVRQSVYFHEIQIRYSVPGWYNKLRAWQQHSIANRALHYCQAAGTSISFYLQYIIPSHMGGRKSSVATDVQIIPVPPNIPVHYKQITNSTNIQEITEIQQPPLKFNQHSSEFGHPSPLPPSGGKGQGRGEGLACLQGRGEVLASFSNRALPSLVEALARIQKNHPALEVVWLGHASDTDMDALVKNCTRYGLKARITGAVPLEKLAVEMELLDLMLLPQPLESGSEGGISLKNGTLSAAMAAALPIIATRGDMTDTGLLQHGKNIHLLQDNAVDSWQKAIEQLLQDADYSDRLSDAGYVFYSEHLSWEVVGRGFEGLIGL
jgi:glycosyltransferase involved in cell wall biosynthesis